MDDTQVGKVVTIFPPRDDGKEYLNTEQAKTIIQSIDTALSGRGLTGPSVSGEQSVGTCRLIYARYGALKQTKENEYGDKLRVLDKLGDPTSNWEEDERSRIKPTWIPELVI